MGFFEKAFLDMPEDEKENFYKSIIMNMEGDYAARKRVEYYRTKLKHMGNNVYIAP